MDEKLKLPIQRISSRDVYGAHVEVSCAMAGSDQEDSLGRYFWARFFNSQLLYFVPGRPGSRAPVL